MKARFMVKWNIPKNNGYTSLSNMVNAVNATTLKKKKKKLLRFDKWDIHVLVLLNFVLSKLL